MLAGVTIVDPASTWIDAEAVLEPDAVIHPFTVIRGASSDRRTRRGRPACGRRSTRPSERTRSSGRSVTSAPGTVLGAGAKAGTFVEIKNARVGERTKVPHLTYLGDADVGADTNIAAGNITANQEHTRVKEQNDDRQQRQDGGRQCIRRPCVRSATTHGLQQAP